jgi:transposase
LNIQLLLQSLQQTINEQAAIILNLQERIRVLENKKNSSNSSIAPSQDENRPKKNQSLWEKTDKKVGGQPGHKGTTLTISGTVDSVVKHSPTICTNCGVSVEDIVGELLGNRKVLDIPPIVLHCTEHQLYKKQCSCGCTMQGSYPAYVTSALQYGPQVEALVSYLHARQYVPYQRMEEFLKDVMNLPISQGSICNILQRMAVKATPMYEAIKEKIVQATYIGADETGVNINGKKQWTWVWQNNQLTYIVCAVSRGIQTITDNFINGLPNAVLGHDRWAAHFSMDAKAHQVCTAHLLRDLNYLNQLYQNNCQWAIGIKQLLLDAITLKKTLTENDYNHTSTQKNVLFAKLHELLHYPIEKEHEKSITLQKSLLAKQTYILYFLLQHNVPPDNNGSERAIRNIKVKQKISGQFKTMDAANIFAILRSVIDTTIKSGYNVLYQLKLIAALEAE